MYLGIDLGTSAVKVCLIDAMGQVAGTGTAALVVQHPFAGASEQDPADWWTAVIRAVSVLPHGLRQQVRAVGLSGQMHGAVLLDRTRIPIRPAILWNDGRASEESADILRAEPQAGVLSGAPPMPGFTAPKMLWLARHEPETHARIAHVLLPKDYIGLRLHGGLVTDPSDAAGTGWFDQVARGWSDRLCAVSETARAWLPEVRHGTEIAGLLTGPAAEILGLRAGIPIASGAGDAAAGAVGIGAVADGDGFLSLGTSGQLFVTTDSYRPNLESRVHAYAHTLPDRWFQMAAMLNGARPLAWLADLLDRPIEDLISEAQAAPPGPLFLPYLSGERTPHGDAAIRAGFAFLDERTSHGGLMRAVVEAVAFSFADALAAVSQAGPVPERLLAIGGGTRSDFLLQMIADATGRVLLRARGAEVGPALGAARLAQAALGEGGDAVYAKPVADKTFVPNPRTQGMQDRLGRYRAFYLALKSIT